MGKDKKKEEKKSSELETLGYIVVIAGIFGAGVYLYNSGKTGGVLPQCNCPPEWDPVCAVVELPDDWETRLPPQEVQRIKQSQPQNAPGSEPEDSRYQALPSKPGPMRYPYPNSCEAQCFGLQNLEPGVCPGTRPSFKCYYESGCAIQPKNEVCWFGFPHDNECAAGCIVREEFGLSFDPKDLQPGKCKDPCKRAESCPKGRACVSRPGPKFDATAPDHKCMDLKCNCKQEWAPVCALGVTYSNECYTQCEGFGVPGTHTANVIVTPGECLHKDPGYSNPIPFPKPTPKKKREKRTIFSSTPVEIAEGAKGPGATEKVVAKEGEKPDL